MKRYLNWCQPTHGHEMMEDSEGPFVAFEDVEPLLAALHMVLKVCAAHSFRGNSDECAAFREARAAIAKAEGK